MTEQELEAIRERRFPEGREWWNGNQLLGLGISSMVDIPALLGEVETLARQVDYWKKEAEVAHENMNFVGGKQA